MGSQKFSFVSCNDFSEDKGGTGILILAVVLLAVALAVAFWPDGNKTTVSPTTIMEMTPADAVTLGDVVVDIKGKPKVEITKEESPDGKDMVVKQRSDRDGEYYFVSASLPDKKRAADTLAEVHRRSQYLMQSLDEMLDGGAQVKASDGVDLTDNINRLIDRHYQKKIPFAEYHNPHDKTVGSNSAKGTLIEMCLRNKYNTDEWNPVNTMFRVHVHELTHSADKEYREDGDHGPVFNRIMNFLLQTSENLGIYSCKEYKESGRKYCGLVLTEEDHACG